MVPNMMFWQFCTLLLCFIPISKGQLRPPVEVSDHELVIPTDPEKCYNRPNHWQWAPANENKRNYFYSYDVPEYRNFIYDWLAARNLCRQHCMDAVAIETEEENNMILNFMYNHDIYNYVGPTWRDNRQCGPSSPFSDGTISGCDPIGTYPCCGDNGFCYSKLDGQCDCPNCVDYTRSTQYIWTSGRLCDFSGCEDRHDLLPLNIKGWFWSSNLKPIADTDKIHWNYQPWSPTGHTGAPQPDNAEFGINQSEESCMAVLNNVYEDGLTWHDIACYHKKPVICEDSDELLNYIYSNFPQ